MIVMCTMRKNIALISLLMFFYMNFGVALCQLWCHSAEHYDVIEVLVGATDLGELPHVHSVHCDALPVQKNLVTDRDSCAHDGFNLRSLNPQPRVKRLALSLQSVSQFQKNTFPPLVTIANYYSDLATLIPLHSLTFLRTVVLLN